MERVVYLLGAGFSAPFGLPVMSNFLDLSKDLYFQSSHEYSSFPAIYERLKEMSLASQYFNTDLHNIEEVLSILELQEQLKPKGDREEFEDFILDVVQGLTPTFPIRRYSNLGPRWGDEIFLLHTPAELFQAFARYARFVAGLLQLTFVRKDKVRGPITVGSSEGSELSYSVVSLNYDLVLENLAEYFRKSADKSDDNVSFVRPDKSNVKISKNEQEKRTVLAKLHGSADTGQVVPPTWNKNLGPEIQATWRTAYELLARANHIRVIGYSLPTADAYVRFLLKSAIIGSVEYATTTHLKSFHVVCLDDESGSVQGRYNAFISPFFSGRYRFLNADALEYLASFDPLGHPRDRVSCCDWNERQHRKGMDFP